MCLLCFCFVHLHFLYFCQNFTEKNRQECLFHKDVVLAWMLSFVWDYHLWKDSECRKQVESSTGRHVALLRWGWVSSNLKIGWQELFYLFSQQTHKQEVGGAIANCILSSKSKIGYVWPNALCFISSGFSLPVLVWTIKSAFTFWDYREQKGSGNLNLVLYQKRLGHTEKIPYQLWKYGQGLSFYPLYST